MCLHTFEEVYVWLEESLGKDVDVFCVVRVLIFAL